MNPDEAEIVRRAYQLFLETMSISEVVRYLKSVSNKKWTSTTAKNLLKSETYVGNYLFGNWRKDQAHLSIVDQQTWDSVHCLLGARLHSPPSRERRCHDRGLVKCPYCGCSYTNGAAKGGAVRYYQCLHDTKRLTKCPVGRVNADALHSSVLREVERAAQHRTVMHQVIAESQGWGSAPEALHSLRGQLAKKKQLNDLHISTIAEGRSIDTLLDSLEKLERQREEIAQQLAEVESQIVQSTTKRPMAIEVQQVWGELCELWNHATEEEKAIILPSIVREVVVHEKSRVSLVLTAIPEVHDSKFVITENLGAGVGFEPTTSGL
ncbi:MAG: recombinase family protein [Armatimonadota bacterium]